MTVNLYSCLADPRDLYKETKSTLIASVSAEPFFPIDITTPVFRLAYNSSFTSINYCYVSELGRWYFIDKITLESGTAMIIGCTCDVLMSFRSDILALDCICTRNQYDYNPYIEDDIPTSVKATTENYIMLQNTPFILPSDENVHCYILNLNGLVGEPVQ